jgi:ribonuclease P protein component
LSLQPARYGLTKSRRLRSGDELREVTRQGRRIRDSLFSVHTRANSHGHARLGLTVSRRVSTRAVVRNRIKRCIRESFRQAQSKLDGLDLVVVAQPHAGDAEPASLRASLQRHWINARQ